MGMPVVSTDFGGGRDFLRRGAPNAYLVDVSEMTEIGPDQPGRWASVDMDSLTSQMRAARAVPREEAREAGREARKQVRAGSRAPGWCFGAFGGTRGRLCLGTAPTADETFLPRPWTAAASGVRRGGGGKRGGGAAPRDREVEAGRRKKKEKRGCWRAESGGGRGPPTATSNLRRYRYSLPRVCGC